jgi:hypothetical protein
MGLGLYLGGVLYPAQRYPFNALNIKPISKHLSYQFDNFFLINNHFKCLMRTFINHFMNFVDVKDLHCHSLLNSFRSFRFKNGHTTITQWDLILVAWNLVRVIRFG